MSGAPLQQLLWHLLAGTRGGVNRLRIVDEILREPVNPHQLAERLGLDYRTTRHHIDILTENGLLAKRGGDAYGARVHPSHFLLANAAAVDEIRLHVRRVPAGSEAPPRPGPGPAGGE